MDMTHTVEALVEELPTMSRERMASVWRDTFGSPPARQLRRSTMIPILAFGIQEREDSFACREMRQRLALAQKALCSDDRVQSVGTFKTGTRIIREWGGVIHEVQVEDEGYLYLGKTYKSLSPIANLITGTRWSGPTFFGTKPKGAKK
jgi:hypothetical protein